jgi:signal transduction histidine kinase
MRIIKSNKGYYKTFAETLVESSPAFDPYHSTTPKQLRKSYEGERKLSKFMEGLIDYELALYNAETFEDIAAIVKMKANEILEVKDIIFFYYDEGYDDFVPVNRQYSKAVFEIIKIIKQDDIFDHLVNQDKIVLIPISQSLQIREGINNLLFVPIRKWRMNNYFVCLDTPLRAFENESYEGKALKVILSHSVPIIENMNSKKKLNKIYDEFQLYQSKFMKDFRLAAIGELTLGLAEQIISPMQVILSAIEMISEDNKNDGRFLETIHSQVKKVKSVVKRLVKFSSISSSDIHIKPVRLNRVIREYVDVIDATLRARKVECILDLDKDIPQILSHPSYLHVMLSTVFTIVNNQEGKSGMIIQTRYNDDGVFIKFITTNFVEALATSPAFDEQNVDLLILNNIVKKHQGKISYRTNAKDGTKLIIKFPILRRMAK